MSQTYQHHQGLMGAAGVVQVGSSASFAIACEDSQRVGLVDASAKTILGVSVPIGARIRAITYAGSKLWTIGADGIVRRLTTATPPAVNATVDVMLDDDEPASTFDWITTLSGFVIAPGEQGEIVAINPSTALIVARFADVASTVAYAIAANGYVYAFDGRGLGTILAVDAGTGAISRVGEFTARACVDVLSGAYDAAAYALVLACGALSSRIVVDLSVPLVPVVGAPTRYPGRTLTGALTDVARSPLTIEDGLGALALTYWWPITGGIWTSGYGFLLLHGRNGRVSFL